MKRNYYISLSMAVLLGTVACHAKEAAKLIVTSKSGTHNEFDLTKIGKITFSDTNNMVIQVAGNSDKTLNINDILEMTFDVQISGAGAEKIEADAGDDLHIALENNIMTLTERNGKEIEAMVFGVNGARVQKANGLGTLQLNFSTLNRGVYIIKVNNKTIKYIR